MDPITAFQVAGTVVTFVEFAYNLISETRTIYKSPDGRKPDVAPLSTVIKDLAGIGDQVTKALDASTSRASTASDETLIRLCRECQDITIEIRTVLGSLQARGTSRLDHAKASVVIAAKSMWSKSKLEKLEQRLQQIRSEMMMAMLVALWEKERLQGANSDQGLSSQIRQISQAVDRNNAKLDDFFRDLDQMTTTDEVLGPAKREALFRKLWEAEWRPSDAHVRHNLQVSAGDGKLDENIQSQIIQSPQFSDIEAREKAIPKPYDNTYRWIFRNQLHNTQGGNRQSFRRWLQESSSKVYWITGKPGSGKSTLMNFIVNHSLTKQHLQAWAGTLPLLRGYFYFWEAGQNNLQKSREGLLQTLLWQCLRSRPDMVARVTPQRWTVHHILRGLETPGPAWSWDELRSAFSNLVSENGKSFKLALFLDGLDEFEGEPAVLIQFVRDLVTNHGVKVCVASRPWTDFSDAFDQYPMLAMQSLTQNDISSFIRDNFEACRAFRERRALFPEQAKDLLQEISNKAQGVFLWVFLVVRDLIHSLSRGRSLSDLQEVVNDLPTDLFKLYSRMGERVEPEDFENSARYYQLMIATLKPLHAVTLWMADGEDLPEGGSFTNEMEENMNLIVQRRLDSSTKGLLELGDNGIVTFLHRTARDWVLQTTESERLRAQAPEDFNPNLVLLEVLTRRLGQDKIHRHLGFSGLAFWDFVFLGFLYATQVVDSPSISQRLVRAVDKFDAALCERAASLGRKGYIFSSKLATPQASALPKAKPWFSLWGKRKKGSSACANHWSLTQEHSDFIGNNRKRTVGIAAQFAVVPYVRVKVEDDKSLIKPDATSRPLLANAIFGWQDCSYRTYEDMSHYGPIAKRLQEQLICQRLEMVKTLLSLGAQPNEAGCYLLDTVEELGEDVKTTPSQEYWDQVLTLLRAGRRRSRFGIK
ncbi:hypothetical protein MRS44_018088 [Fusarium solani]|uniref:uncharacterized protein n=1 Tax=Fusarium solani TaxID=169388 RepID=UPI0032C48633|nr:hypothetical protein MRS44_018088 [Fusarium solani]